MESWRTLINFLFSVNISVLIIRHCSKISINWYMEICIYLYPVYNLRLFCWCTNSSPPNNPSAQVDPPSSTGWCQPHMRMGEHCKTAQVGTSICLSINKVIPSRYPHLYFCGFFASLPSTCRAWKETLILQQTQLWTVSLCEICCPFVCCWQA